MAAVLLFAPGARRFVRAPARSVAPGVADAGVDADGLDRLHPDLVADWFRRNIRIYRNIVALVGSPDERVLVVYGAGHLGWLRQMAASDARVQLRTLAEVVRQR
jgi:hypothetical protein